jgi:hypothetical protein
VGVLGGLVVLEFWVRRKERTRATCLYGNEKLWIITGLHTPSYSNAIKE